MKKIILFTCLLSLMLGLQAKIEVYRESNDLLELKFQLGDYTISRSNDFEHIVVAGLGYQDIEGAPMLPEITYYIAVPADGTIDYSIKNLVSEKKQISGVYLPSPKIIRGDQGGEYIYEVNEQLYLNRRNSFISIGEKMRFRYNFVIPLTISPVIYNYNQRELEIADSIEITIIIRGDTNKIQAPIDSLEHSELIINHKSAKNWQSTLSTKIEYAPFDDADYWYRFEINQNGMYELTYNQLSILPLSDIDPRTIRIFTNGGELLSDAFSFLGNPFKEVPLLVIGEENGVFNTTDSVIFYAENRDGFEKNKNLSNSVKHYYNPYSGRGVYWLTFAGRFTEPAKRMTNINITQSEITRTNAPEYVHFENENVRREHFGFTWFNSLLTGIGDTNHNFSFSAANVDTSQPQTLSIALQGDLLSPGATTNRISVRINDVVVMNSIAWSGAAYRSFSAGGNFTVSGNNNLALTVHRIGSNNIYFDYFGVEYYKLMSKSNNGLYFNRHDADDGKAVSYQFNSTQQNLRAFEIAGTHETNTLTLRYGSGSEKSIIGRDGLRYAVINNGEYFSVSGLQEIIPVDLLVADSDNVIISADIFLNSAERLSQLYADMGDYKTTIVKQQDIFNQFNSGMPDPNAIRLYLRHNFKNNTSLKNVVLLGSGTIDWRNFSGQATEKNKIMVFQKGSNSSDDYFVDMTGNTLPDIGIGRLTAQNNAQMEIIVNKIINYRTNPEPGMWRNTPLFVADDEFTNSSTNEAIHSVQIQSVSQVMSPAVLTDKLFAFEYPFDSLGNKPLVRNEIVRRINEGRSLWYYIGHGAYDLMGHESYFRTVDIDALRNGDRLPLFIAASCDVGKFDYFSYNSISERLLVHPHGGSIASLAATGLTSPSPNAGLMEGFLNLVLNNYSPPGIALMQAKNMNSNQSHNNRRYAYLGDPVVPIVMPQRNQGLSVVTASDSLFAYQVVEVEGVFSESNLDGAADFYSFSSEYDLSYTVQSSNYVIDYTKWGNPYHRGKNKVENGELQASFIIPGDINKGNRGRLLSYFYDDTEKKDYLSYYFPAKTTNIAYANAVNDTIPPTIRVWLDTENFRNGDTVSSNPLLNAEIEDDSGINILGELGHKILLVMDTQSTPIDITAGFTYDLGSYQKGKLIWQLNNLSEGEHRLQMIVFDNYNNPAVADIEFKVSSKESIVISDVLPYPNPVSNDSNFTFKLSGEAAVTITIYTIRGRKIRTLQTQGMNGYNQLYWDGRDGDGDRIANGTYLYKVRAVDSYSGKSTEKIEKIVILR